MIWVLDPSVGRTRFLRSSPSYRTSLRDDTKLFDRTLFAIQSRDNGGKNAASAYSLVLRSPSALLRDPNICAARIRGADLPACRNSRSPLVAQSDGVGLLSILGTLSDVS